MPSVSPIRRRFLQAINACTLGIACLVSASAAAMTFHANPPFLYLGGSVVASDWQAWEEAVKRFGGTIDTVVLHDSGGGDSKAGRKIGMSIREQRWKTVVFGRCSSACANMFLGGTERQFAANAGSARTVLGYHGSYNKKTKEMLRKKSGDYFLMLTDGKMSEEFVERFIRIENKKGLLRFVHPEQRAKPGDPLALLCLGDEERDKRDEQCERLADVDALSAGVVTTWTVRSVPRPPKPSREKVTIKNWEGSIRETR